MDRSVEARVAGAVAEVVRDRPAIASKELQRVIAELFPDVGGLTVSEFVVRFDVERVRLSSAFGKPSATRRLAAKRLLEDLAEGIGNAGEAQLDSLTTMLERLFDTDYPGPLARPTDDDDPA